MEGLPQCIDDISVSPPSLSNQKQSSYHHSTDLFLAFTYNNFKYLRSAFPQGDSQINCFIPVTHKAPINLVLVSQLSSMSGPLISQGSCP